MAHPPPKIISSIFTKLNFKVRSPRPQQAVLSFYLLFLLSLWFSFVVVAGSLSWDSTGPFLIFTTPLDVSRYFVSSQLATPFQPFLCKTFWYFRIPSLFSLLTGMLLSLYIRLPSTTIGEMMQSGSWILPSRLNIFRFVTSCLIEVWRLPARCLASFSMCDQLQYLAWVYRIYMYTF